MPPPLLPADALRFVSDAPRQVAHSDDAPHAAPREGWGWIEAFAAIQLLFGIDAPVSVLIVRDMLLKSVYAFFLGWPIYLLVRRVLRPALVEEPRVQRRRQPTVLGA